MQVLGYTPQRHDRFYVGGDKAFGWQAYDWSGVGRGIFNGNPVGWCCLISDTYFITANHFPGGGVSGVRFWRSTDPADFVDMPAAVSFQQVDAQADVCLGRLSTPAPSWVKRFPIGSGYAGELGLEVVGVGFGVAYGGIMADQRFGRNNVDVLYNQPTSGYKQEFEYVNDHAVGFNPDEFEYEGGDSGGPSFAILGGIPVLVGEHHAISGTFASFDSSVSSFSSAIQTLVQAGGENVTITAVVPVVPVAPTLNSVVAGSAQATLTWTELREATTYSVYRSTSSGTETLLAPGLPKTLDGTTHSYTDTGLTNGTTYFYKVTATNGGGEGPLSNEQSVVPVLGAPVLQSAVPGNGQILLGWANPGGATTYKVYRGIAPGGEALTIQGLTSIFFRDGPGLTNGTRYYYKVSAVDGTGEGPLSNELSAIPAVIPMAVSYLEIYLDAANGSNTRSGHTTEASPLVSTNGAYTQGGGAGGTSDRWTAAAGTPFSGRSVGELVAFMADGGTIATQISRILAINAGGASIDVGNANGSLMGVQTATAASGITATCGGALKGPNGTSFFPYNLGGLSLFTDVSGNFISINWKTGTTYTMTGAAAAAVNGPAISAGYTTTPRDGGRAKVDGGTVGASYTITTLAQGVYEDIEFSNNGSTGSATLLIAGTASVFRRCVFHDSAGSLVSLSALSAKFESCEFYLANKNNNAGVPAFTLAGTARAVTLLDCTFHDNAGSNTDAVIVTANTTHTFIGCIFDTNGRDGILVSSSGGHAFVENCEFYNNGKDGIESSAGSVFVRNSNFCRNINGVNRSAGTNPISVSNCGFGSGADANSNANIAGVPSEIEGSITYTIPTNPWRDPANGDFTIVSAQARGQGRGKFLATQAAYTGQTGFPDVGASQHQEPGRIF